MRLNISLFSGLLRCYLSIMDINALRAIREAFQCCGSDKILRTRFNVVMSLAYVQWNISFAVKFFWNRLLLLRLIVMRACFENLRSKLSSFLLNNKYLQTQHDFIWTWYWIHCLWKFDFLQTNDVLIYSTLRSTTP